MTGSAGTGDSTILRSLVDGLRPADDGLREPATAAWVAEIVATTAGMIADADGDIPDLPVAEILRAAHDSLLRIVQELAGAPTDRRLTDAQIEMVRYSAARNIPFERMVAGLRLAQSHWTDVLLGEVGKTGRWAVAGTVVKAVVRQIDAVVDASVREYLRERERLLTGVEARRRELVEALVAGRAVDAAECRTHLGLDLGHRHLAMIVRDVSATHPPDELLRTADRAARAVGARTSLVHQPSPDTVWVWASHPRTVSLDGLASEEESVRRSGLRLAAGSPRAGADGVRRSHRDALAADRMPTPPEGGPAVVCYRDVDLSALLAADLEQARCFVRDHLGGLVGAGPDVEELRRTLTEYYRVNSSLLAAAAPLHVHRNTVVYRLRRIEQLLGHPVTEQTLEVRCALLLVERFGAAVLYGVTNDGS